MDSCASATGFSLWPFQETGVQKIEAALERVRRLMVCSPTGSGKTVLATTIMRKALAKGERSLFMAPRHELLGQVAAKLDRFAAFDYGMIVANKRGTMNLYLPIQVASVDTLVSRCLKRQSLILPPIHNVIIDEAHLYMTQHRNALMQLFPYARIVGFSATPGRHDGRALDLGFDELVEIATPKQLIEQGYLVQPIYYAPSAPDMKRVKQVAGEYNRAETDVRMEPLLGDVVESWLKLAPDRRTAVFANSIGQSIFLAEKFRAFGVAAEHCDGGAEPALRDAIFERFRSGETQVLCNVDLATYGFDLPELDCVSIARPTLSVVRYLQMVGRGLRVAKGKRDCIVLDHSGCFYMHGPAEEDRHWSLGGVRDVTSSTKREKTGQLKKKTLHLKCKKCAFVFGGSLTCPQCGYYFEKAAQKFAVVDGELQQIREREEDLSELERMRFYCELLGYVAERNRKIHSLIEAGKKSKARPWSPGWAAHAYKTRYGQFPPRQWDTYDPMSPSLATQRFVKYLAIRKRHRAAKEAAAA